MDPELRRQLLAIARQTSARTPISVDRALRDGAPRFRRRLVLAYTSAGGVVLLVALLLVAAHFAVGNGQATESTAPVDPFPPITTTSPSITVTTESARNTPSTSRPPEPPAPPTTTPRSLTPTTEEPSLTPTTEAPSLTPTTEAPSLMPTATTETTTLPAGFDSGRETPWALDG